MNFSTLTEILNRLFHVITDWLLILFGCVLFFVAFRAIDVAAIQYIVMAIGVTMVITGFWCRFKRLQKKY